jgi:uncharacterized protein (DUF58 family)
MKRILSALTATGKMVVVTFLVTLILTFITGWAELSILSLGCFVALLFGALYVARPQSVSIKRTLVPPRISVGESSIGVIEIKNTMRRRSGPRLAEDRIGEQSVRVQVPALAPGERVELPYTVDGRERGLLNVGPVVLNRADPLGLFQLLQGQGSTETLWVRPRAYPVAVIASGWAKDLDGPTSDNAPTGSAAFHALRAYQWGDDLRRVHWRTTARTGELMVRHFVDTQRSRELIILDPRASVYTDSSFEAALEVIASIALSSALAEHEIVLATPGQHSHAKYSVPQHEFLDRLVIAERSEIDLPEVFREARQFAGEATACIVVTGDAVAEHLLRQARVLSPTGLIIVVRCVEGLRPSLSAAAEGLIIETPSAEQLAGVWQAGVQRA